MIHAYVDANSMTCMMNRDSIVESKPEPFRMQDTVSFHVTYSEYINYITSLPLDTPVTLSKATAVLKQYLNATKDKLYSCYLQDVAFAICKEIAYAERYGKNASVILPSSTVTPEVGVDVYIQSYPLGSTVEGELLGFLQSAGFEPFKVKSSRNQCLLKLACCLYYVAKNYPNVREVNLVYNLNI